MKIKRIAELFKRQLNHKGLPWFLWGYGTGFLWATFVCLVDSTPWWPLLISGVICFLLSVIVSLYQTSSSPPLLEDRVRPSLEDRVRRGYIKSGRNTADN